MIGIDEVGRGALAGPLVVAAVRFGKIPDFAPLLNDSKLLSRKKRELLSGLITSTAEHKIHFSSVAIVDRLGLTVAIRNSILKLLSHFDDDSIVIDGTYNFLRDTSFEQQTICVKQADSKYLEVMAASIIAKVARDSYMRKLHEKYPGYAFFNNVGYGTVEHIRAINSLGVTIEHRTSFAPVAAALGDER